MELDENVGTVFKVNKKQLGLLKLRKKMKEGTAADKFIKLLRSSNDSV